MVKSLTVAPRPSMMALEERGSLNRIRTAAVCALAALSGDVLAGTASSPFTVTGTVVANCTISTTGISFTYDPVALNAALDALASGTVTVACTKGSAPSIGLDNGLY